MEIISALRHKLNATLEAIKTQCLTNTVRLKGKGERGKVSNTSFTPYPLTFSQTTREVHTAYPNRIECLTTGSAETENWSISFEEEYGDTD